MIRDEEGITETYKRATAAQFWEAVTVIIRRVAVTVLWLDWLYSASHCYNILGTQSLMRPNEFIVHIVDITWRVIVWLNFKLEVASWTDWDSANVIDVEQL